MRLRKAIKKVVALGAGLTMLGATIFGATAADLGNYPAPFIKDGVFNGIIVVGDTAKASDIIGAIDIATSLQYMATKQVPVSTGSGSSSTVVVEGDAYKISKEGNKLNAGIDKLDSVISKVTGDDLKALAPGSITNEKGTFDYNQYIEIGNGSVRTVEDSKLSDDPVTVLRFATGDLVYRYQLVFTTPLQSDVNSKNKLDDLENKKITMLGKEYTITKATYNESGNERVKLELMAGAVEDTLNAGSSKTYTLKGKDYNVELRGVFKDSDDNTVALFQIGSDSLAIKAGETKKLSDGTEIGVRYIFQSSSDSGASMVQFYLGASKIVISGKLNQTTSDKVVVGDTTTKAVAKLKGKYESGDVKLSEIDIEYIADRNLDVAVGKKLSDYIGEYVGDKYIDNLFLRSIDYQFAAVNRGTPEDYKIEASDKELKLTVVTKTGGEFTFTPFSTNGTVTFFGDKGDDGATDLIVNSSNKVEEDNYVVLSSDKYTHIIKVSEINTDDGKVTFEDVATGDSIEYTPGCDEQGDLNLDGHDYTFTLNCTGKYVKFNDFGTDYDSAPGSNVKDTGVVIFTKEGAAITLEKASSGEPKISFYQEKGETQTNDYSTAYSVTVNLDTSYKKFDINSDAVSNVNMHPWESKDDYKTGATPYGMKFYLDYGNDKVTVSYPSEEMSLDVYITTGATKTETVEGGSGEVMTTQINRIPVGVAKLASEVGSLTDNNMIVVGGPCVNSVAAQLMGNPQPCSKGFEEGKAIIKLYENGDKVAMLVAGATALDTRRACRVVANYQDYAFKGKELEVKGTSTTFSDTVVSAVEQTQETQEQTQEQTESQ